MNNDKISGETNNETKYLELTNPQQRIWLTELMNNHKDMSNIGYLIHLKSEYDLPTLEKAIRHTVKANTGLQLRFKVDDTDKSKLLQYFPEHHETQVHVIEAETEKELYDKIEALHRNRFNIDGGTFCSFAVFSIGGKTQGLFEKAHHLVADGVSATIVAREIIDTYNKLKDNTFEETIKENKYSEFVEAEQEYIESAKYIKNKTYWEQRFEDFEGRDITFETDKNKKNSLKVNRLSFEIPEHLRENLETFKTGRRFSNFGLFMAALAVYLNRFMNHGDMVLGMPVHNRSNKIFKNMAGMFVSTLPFRIKFEENWTFNNLVDYLKAELMNALRHQSYPYNHLVSDLKDMGIDAAGLLNVQVIELPPSNHDEIEKRSFFNTQYNISQLSVYLNQQNIKDVDQLDIAVDYHADIFSTCEVKELFNRLMVILEQTLAAPDTPMPELSLLQEPEYRRIIHELNPAPVEFPRANTLHGLFGEQVEKNRDAIALEYDGETVTYGELNALTDTLATRLMDAGLEKGSIVGMLSDRSIEAVVSILSVLKAGCAYVPIDPGYPIDRKNYIIANSGLNFLLVENVLLKDENQLIESNPGVRAIPVDLGLLRQETKMSPQSYTDPGVTSEDICYVIYTSGTTGNPKGTLLRHRNVINYVTWGARHYVGDRETTFPLFTSLSFDLTVTSIFIPLITGNKMVIYRESADSLLVEKVALENKVDIMKLTPSHLKVVNSLNLESPRIRSFILGGEELTVETSARSLEVFGKDTNIYNEYGPTETAVGCMIHRFDKATDTGRSVPVGKPSDNVRIYILDKNKKPLPMGIMGEIYIAGQGVALGYLNNDALTREKFVDDPFVEGEKMYKSGDLGRWNLDGVIEFFGRCDEQVKIRGFRIEPGEIETQLQALDGIEHAVVLVNDDTPGSDPELAAYFVPGEPGAFDVSRLRDLLSRELPAYMLPARFVEVENIPLTRNGKVDKRKLATMGTTLEASHEFVAPQSDMETMLAEIWSGVLGSERIGITDNFFELGGDSIKAVQIAARLNDAHKTVNVKDILTHQTIANLCANVDFDSHVRHWEQGTISGEKPIVPIEGWFLSQDFKHPGHYHQSVFLQFKAAIDIEKLRDALTRLAGHHDGLRLNWNDKKKTFYFNNDLVGKPVEVEEIDLSHVPADGLADFIAEAADDARANFDIQNGSMIRALVFRSDTGPDKLLLILHHLVVDGLTWRILLEQFYQLYTDLSGGKEPELPQKTASLLDWYDAMVLFRDSGKLEAEKEYWQEADASDFMLPYDGDPSTVDWSTKNRNNEKNSLDAENTAFLLKDAHESYKTDTQILVTAALVRTLRQWTGKQKVTIEMENHGRHIEDMDTTKTTGWFTAIYPLHIKREDSTIGDEIKTVKEAIRNVPNNGLGYGIMKYMTGSAESANFSKPKRAEVRFNYLGQFAGEVENSLFSYCPESTGSDVSPENHMTAALEINAMVINDVFTLDFNYNSNAHKDETISGLAQDYIKNLKEILDHIRGEDDVHFTSSDFDTVDLGEDDLEALFG